MTYSDWEPEPFPEGWEMLDEAQRSSFKSELELELSPGHPLFGLGAIAVAKCQGCDETLIHAEHEDGQRWSLVHLTWRRGPENLPWPLTTIYEAPMPLIAMAEHSSHVLDTSQPDELESIKQAILNGQSDQVWSTLRKMLNQSATRDPGRLDPLLDLALRKGVLASVMPLIIHGATSETWAPSPELLLDYLAEISSGWNAGWLEDIEFEAYNLMIGEPTSETWQYQLSNRQIDDLRMLAARFNGWAIWDETGPQFIPMNRWRPAHAAWKQSPN